MIYGYARISTKAQSIDRQIRNIKAAYPEAVVLCETWTGTSIDRKEWQKLNRILKQSDTVVFDSVSRMSRNAKEGFDAYQDLYNKGITLVFLKEPHINTETYKSALESSQLQPTGTAVDYILNGVTQYLMALASKQIELAFEQAEKEVQDLRQRTREGIVTAKLNGKQIGIPKGSKLTTKKSVAVKCQIVKYSKDFNGNLKDTDVRKLTGVSKNTYYKYKRELKAAAEQGEG